MEGITCSTDCFDKMMTNSNITVAEMSFGTVNDVCEFQALNHHYYSNNMLKRSFNHIAWLM